jgi:hypothetical protein
MTALEATTTSEDLVHSFFSLLYIQKQRPAITMTDANTTVIPLLRDSIVAEHEKERRGFLALLICAQREDSPVHMLCDKTDLLRIIHSYSVSDKSHKVQQYLNSMSLIRIDTCAGTQRILVAFLNSDLYDNHYDAGKELDREQGSSISSILSTSHKAVRLAFARALAWETNPDGSWLSEAQLRQRFRLFHHASGCYCWESYGFQGICTALPGDTIYWRWFRCGVHPPRKQATRIQPASDAELQARDHTSGGGVLFSDCKRQRGDPEDSDDEDSEMGGSDDENSELEDNEEQE